MKSEKVFSLSQRFIIFLGIVLIFLGGGLGALITHNVIHNSDEKDQKVYFFDPSKNSKYSVIQVEKEPNDTFEKASPLIPGYETQGTFTTSADIDMYTFTLDSPANAQITLRNLPKEYNVFIYDTNKLLIASSLRAGFLESTSVVELNNPGKYYIKLVDKDGSTNKNYPYTILLNIEPLTE